MGMFLGEGCIGGDLVGGKRGELVSTKSEGLWVKARIGDWDCNLKEWKLGR